MAPDGSLPAAAAWAILICGWALPLLHVLGSRAAGPWRAPEGSACPLGPRAGWLVIVLLCGPVGWLLFRRALSRKHRVAQQSSS